MLRVAPRVLVALVALRTSGTRAGLATTRRRRPSRGSHALLPDGDAAPALAVAIIGRPNVGKSSLFNRLVGRQLALVDRVPGVTRDLREAHGSLAGLTFSLMDTAGLDEARSVVLRGMNVDTAPRGPDAPLARAISSMESVLHDKGVLQAMLRKTELAVSKANLVLFVVDGKAGISPWDRHFAGWIRARLSSSQKVRLVVNKCDTSRIPPAWHEPDGLALGFGEPVYVSAEHGDGMAELYAALRDATPARALAVSDAGAPTTADLPSRAVDPLGTPEEERAKRHLRSGVKLCIIGRPNVGKSSLANALVGEDRFIVGDMPGVTQDAVYVQQRWPLPDGAEESLALLGIRPERAVAVEAETVSGGAGAGARAGANVGAGTDVADGADDGAELDTETSAAIAAAARELDESELVLTDWSPEDNSVPVTIVDTAGMMRRTARENDALANVPKRLAALAYDDAMRAIRLSHVVVLVVDATVGFHKTDAMIADAVAREGRGLVVALSKWDAVANPDERLKRLAEELPGHLPYQLRNAPLLRISTVRATADGRAKDALWPALWRVYVAWNRRVPTGLLNQWLRKIVTSGAPASPSKVTYATQVAARPPAIAVFANAKTSAVARHWESWIRFITAELRTSWGLDGVPLRVRVRMSEEGRRRATK